MMNEKWELKSRSFFYLINKYLSRIQSVPGTFKVLGDTAVNKNLCLHGAYILVKGNLCKASSSTTPILLVGLFKLLCPTPTGSDSLNQKWSSTIVVNK